MEAIESLRQMLHTIDGNNVGSKRMKSKVRNMLTKLEAVQQELNEG
jgi:hypothetical protein